MYERGGISGDVAEGPCGSLERELQDGEEMAEAVREGHRPSHRKHILAAPGRDNTEQIGIVSFIFIIFRLVYLISFLRSCASPARVFIFNE